jgi:hypothetical protein
MLHARDAGRADWRGYDRRRAGEALEGDMRLHLPDVTLCCVDSTERFAWALRALARCTQAIEFGDALIAADAGRLHAAVLPAGVRAVPIAPLTSIAAYSRFMLERVGPLVNTSHVLVVQWDGFVIDAGRWRPEFLQYDYIGAPWPHVAGRHRVGNGGFSLRSRRLLQAIPPLPADFDEPEDAFIGRTLRPALEAQGLRFAPEPLARAFAVENGSLAKRPFGFHGPAHFPAVLGAPATIAFLRTLAPATLLATRTGRDLALGLAAGIAREDAAGSPAMAEARARLGALLAAAIDAAAGSGGVEPAELDRLCRGLIRSRQLAAARRLIAVAGLGRPALQLRLLARTLQQALIDRSNGSGRGVPVAD